MSLDETKVIIIITCGIAVCGTELRCQGSAMSRLCQIKACEVLGY